MILIYFKIEIRKCRYCLRWLK